jgi:hypothetical protein
MLLRGSKEHGGKFVPTMGAKKKRRKAPTHMPIAKITLLLMNARFVPALFTDFIWAI